MHENHLRILCSVLKTDLVLESEDGTLTSFSDMIEDSPLMNSAELRILLRNGAVSQKEPFLYLGTQECYFAAVCTEQGFLYMGPMCHMKLNAVKRRQMLRA